MASVVNSSTSICGIDVGSENCYVAVARQGGIEILLNEYSQRSTPAYIGFGGNQRELGVSAKQKQMMNLSNTCFAPTLIIGKKFQDLNLAEIPFRVIKGDNDEALIVVTHNGDDLHLTPTQVLAMLFTKLRQISGNVIDCVINCPNYFTDTQKRALGDAAVIAGLNPLKIIPDMTAIALYYGFYRSSSAGQETSIVGFVDCGHSSIQASIVLFNHKDNSMRVLDAGFEADVGGKHFDEILADYFIAQKKLTLGKRARYRLIAECEKVKKQMSANSNELPINIECLQDDKDFSARIDRTTFEEKTQHLLDKIQVMLKRTYENAAEKYKKEFADKYGDFKVDSVEIVGGTSRIPAIKKMVKDILTADPSTTLNADEAVARGCALQCAILSPTFKVAKELQIVDSLAYQINFRYSSKSVQEFKTVNALYPKGHQFPFTKQISLPISLFPITAAFEYINSNGTPIPFAEYEISLPEKSDALKVADEKDPVKLKVRVDANGLFSVVSASYTSEKLNVKNNEAMEQSTNENASEKMETEDGASQNNSEQNDQNSPTKNEEQKRKSKPKTIEFTVTLKSILGKLDKDTVQRYLEFESNLILADKNWKEKTDAKNALEEFIYEWRDRLESGSYDAFINSSNKSSFQTQLEQNENWLYQQDEEEKMHSKSVYDERTSSMANAYANRVLNLKREFENRPRFLEQLGRKLQQASKLSQITENDEQEEFDKFIKEMTEKSRWFDEAQGKLSNAKTFDEPPVKCDEIQQQANHVDSAITKLQNGRNRRAEQKRKAAETAAAEAKKQAEQQQKQQKPESSGDDNGMEVDGNEQAEANA